MHVIPNRLGVLSKVAADNASRYTLNAVHLRVHCDNTFVAEATDAHKAVRVTGPCVPAADYPHIPALDAAPNGHFDALVPAKKWAETFKTATAMTKRIKKQELQTVAVVVGEKQTTFGVSNLTETAVMSAEQYEGRFPPLADVLGKAQRTNSYVATVDVKKLISLLQALEPFTDEGGRVALFANPDSKAGSPLTFVAEADGLRADGLLMPLTAGK